jgi:transcription elongation factor Elf1
MKILTLLALLLTSVNVYADWVDYSCYRNANQKGEQTDKMYSYNDATRKIKLDKKDKEYAGHFRGQTLFQNYPLARIKLK